MNDLYRLKKLGEFHSQLGEFRSQLGEFRSQLGEFRRQLGEFWLKENLKEFPSAVSPVQQSITTG